MKKIIFFQFKVYPILSYSRPIFSPFLSLNHLTFTNVNYNLLENGISINL